MKHPQNLSEDSPEEGEAPGKRVKFYYCKHEDCLESVEHFKKRGDYLKHMRNKHPEDMDELELELDEGDGELRGSLDRLRATWHWELLPTASSLGAPSLLLPRTQPPPPKKKTPKKKNPKKISEKIPKKKDKTKGKKFKSKRKSNKRSKSKRR